MSTSRRSVDVVNQLLSTMTDTVVSYHPTVKRTGTTIAGLIAGTACFPGGAGLWRGAQNGGLLPELFPERPVMFVAHNFDSERAFHTSRERRGEANKDFWQRLISILAGSGLLPSECFFSNALMGLKPGSATGPMPSIPGYREQCLLFLTRQVNIVKPRAVIALGVKAEKYVSRLNHPWTSARHPSDWHFREVVTREERLSAEGLLIRDFLLNTY